LKADSLKIAFFVNYSHKSGTYFRWQNLAIALKQSGHQVDVFAGDTDYHSANRIEERDGIRYHLISSLQTSRIFYNPNDPFTALRRMFQLPDEAYDVYHVFQPFLQAYLPWKRLKRKNPKAVFLYDWDDLWTNGLFTKAPTLRYKYSYWVTEILERKMPLKADGVTVCSDFLAKRVNGKAPQAKLYNGFWDQPLPDKNALKAKWSFNENDFYLGYVGKTAGELDWIVEGLAYLHDQGLHNVKLVICGPPKEWMSSSGILDKKGVIYLGELSPQDAREISASVDLGMIPLENSLFNQSRFPIKFFDFLTVDTSVYLSQVGEIAEIAQTIQGAFLGSPDKNEWIKGLLPVVQKRLSVRPQIDISNIVSRFSWPAIAAELADFYRKLLIG
jgi:glycosyltransferase involved in cell wall biosynthesis